MTAAAAPRRAFTLIELLIVITIIMILVGLLLVGAGVIRRSLMKAKSATICSTMHTALENASALSGLRPAPSEHPLACSATTDLLANGGPGTVRRAIFHRAGGGSAVDRDGEALRVGQLSWLQAADQDRVLLPDDVFVGHASEGDLPLLFGLPREQIGILGASCDWITTWRNLPDVDGPYRDPGSTPVDPKLVTPYDNTKYKDGDFLYRPQLRKEETLEEANKRQLETMLGTHLNELNELGAIRHANDADPASWISATITTSGSNGTTYTRKVDVTQPLPRPNETGSYDEFHRVYIPGEPGPGPNALPGQYRNAAGDWVPYAIRGYSVVDAWGFDVIFWQDRKKNTFVVSAGEDGAFAVDPGRDGVIDTPITDYRQDDPATIHDKDQNGWIDNVGGGK